MAKILITGGAGFVGSNAANQLGQDGYDVVAFDNLFLGWKTHLAPHVVFMEGNVENPQDLDKVGQVDYVIHLAGASSAPMFANDLRGSFANNVLGHINVLEFAQRHGAKKVLFASTSSIYGNNPIPLTEDQTVTPPNHYSVTKYTQENSSRIYHQIHGLEIIAFRFMSVYGLREEHKGRFANLVSQFIWGMEKGKQPTIYGDGTQTRDLTNVRDLIQAFKLAIETPKAFGFTIFNVGTAQATSMLDLMDILNDAMGTSIPAKFVDNPIKTGYVRQQQASIDKITRELGYKPTVDIVDGVRELVAHRRHHPVTPASLSF